MSDILKACLLIILKGGMHCFCVFQYLYEDLVKFQFKLLLVLTYSKFLEFLSFRLVPKQKKKAILF